MVGEVLVPPQQSAAKGRVAKHLSTLALFWIVVSVFRLFGAGGILAVGNFRPFGMRSYGIGPFGAGAWGPPHFMPAVLSMMGGFLLLVAIAGFVVGWGLFQRRQWARAFALILGAVALLDPPFGLFLGLYTLWVLLPSRSDEEYRALARPA